jgi:hypothetical protein
MDACDHDLVPSPDISKFHCKCSWCGVGPTGPLEGLFKCSKSACYMQLCGPCKKRYLSHHPRRSQHIHFFHFYNDASKIIAGTRCFLCRRSAASSKGEWMKCVRRCEDLVCESCFKLYDSLTPDYYRVDCPHQREMVHTEKEYYRQWPSTRYFTGYQAYDHRSYATTCAGCQQKSISSPTNPSGPFYRCTDGCGSQNSPFVLCQACHDEVAYQKDHCFHDGGLEEISNTGSMLSDVLSLPSTANLVPDGYICADCKTSVIRGEDIGYRCVEGCRRVICDRCPARPRGRGVDDDESWLRLYNAGGGCLQYDDLMERNSRVMDGGR